MADMEGLKFPQYSGLPGAPHWHLGPTLAGPLYFGLSSFTSAFRKVTGETPTDYRRRLA